MERWCLVTFSAEEFYSLGNSRARAGCACSWCGRELFGLFFLSFIVSVLSTSLRATAIPHAIFSPPLSGRRLCLFANKNSSVIFCRDRPRFEGSHEIVH